MTTGFLPSPQDESEILSPDCTCSAENFSISHFLFQPHTLKTATNGKRSDIALQISKNIQVYVNVNFLFRLFGKKLLMFSSFFPHYSIQGKQKHLNLHQSINRKPDVGVSTNPIIKRISKAVAEMFLQKSGEFRIEASVNGLCTVHGATMRLLLIFKNTAKMELSSILPCYQTTILHCGAAISHCIYCFNTCRCSAADSSDLITKHKLFIHPFNSVEFLL